MGGSRCEAEVCYPFCFLGLVWSEEEGIPLEEEKEGKMHFLLLLLLPISLCFFSLFPPVTFFPFPTLAFPTNRCMM